MISGLLSGILWALDTVILGVALSSSTYVSTPQAIVLAPFVSTFFHDMFSSIWMLIIMIYKKQLGNVRYALKTRSGKFIALSALLAGPIGMSGYIIAINNIGPGLTSIISSIYPAIGVLLSVVFLKEKITPVQIFGLVLSLVGVVLISYQSDSTFVMKNATLGYIAAFVACVGWALEAVIVAYGLKDANITDEHALTIRQGTSALFYGIVILTIMNAWGFTFSSLASDATLYILLAGIFGTLSYLFYYKSINKIGASKAMPLNITYTAWAIVFSFILLGEKISFRSILLGVVIIFGSILSSIDLNEFRKKSTDKEII